MIKYIASAILAALAILFLCLKSVFAQSVIVALAFVAALSLMWTVILVYDYFDTYRRENLQERYALFCATLVNSSALTLDLIKQNDKIYYKKFKRTLVKEKIVACLKIFLLLGVTIGFFFAFL